LIVSVRNLRAELKIEQKLKIPIQIFAHDDETRILIDQNQDAIKRLANVESIAAVEQSAATQAPSRGTSRFDVRVIYEKQIDVAAERERLKKELEQIEREIGNGQRQLGNEQFLAKAPAKVVEGMRARAQELSVLREKAQSKLEELKTT
jgi:valyl-tRNA synthetase